MATVSSGIGSGMQTVNTARTSRAEVPVISGYPAGGSGHAGAAPVLKPGACAARPDGVSYLVSDDSRPRGSAKTRHAPVGRPSGYLFYSAYLLTIDKLRAFVYNLEPIARILDWKRKSHDENWT